MKYKDLIRNLLLVLFTVVTNYITIVPLSVAQAAVPIATPCSSDVKGQYDAQKCPDWDANASRSIVYDDLNAVNSRYIDNAVKYNNNSILKTQYFSIFQGKLQSWVNAYKARGLFNSTSQEGALIQAIRADLNAFYPTAKGSILLSYPGIPDVLAKGLILQNLVHGFYDYGTPIDANNLGGGFSGQAYYYTGNPVQFATAGRELKLLLRQANPSSPFNMNGSCADYQQLLRVLGRIWDLPVYSAGVSFGASTNYNAAQNKNSLLRPYFSPPIPTAAWDGGTYFGSTHAFVILNVNSGDAYAGAYVLDGNSNLSIQMGATQALGFYAGCGVCNTNYAMDRMDFLTTHGRILGFYNIYMQPDVRAGYLAAIRNAKPGDPKLADASLLNFVWLYYLAGYPGPNVDLQHVAVENPVGASFGGWQIELMPQLGVSPFCQQPLYMSGTTPIKSAGC